MAELISFLALSLFVAFCVWALQWRRRRRTAGDIVKEKRDR